MVEVASARVTLPPLPAGSHGRGPASGQRWHEGAAGPRLRDLAAVARLSRGHLHRRFKLYFGETPLQALARHQVEEAKRLMGAGVLLAEVARAAGFSNQSHFTNRFRQLTSTTPTVWLRAHRRNPW